MGLSITNLREVFDDVDEDGSGKIEFDEFKAMTDTFHLGIGLSKIRQLFNYFDADGDGEISYQDFMCALFPDELVELDEARRASLSDMENDMEEDSEDEE